MRLVSAGQREYELSLALLRDRSERHTGYLLVFHDVTERKRVEEELRYALDLTKSITDNATTAIFLMDADGRCTFANPAAEQMTGFSFEELRGRVLHDHVHPHRGDGSPYPASECPAGESRPTRS